VLTLYTTPVVFLYLDRFGHWCTAQWVRFYAGPPGGPVAEPGE
jgi:multidrug efflux pump